MYGQCSRLVAPVIFICAALAGCGGGGGASAAGGAQPPPSAGAPPPSSPPAGDPPASPPPTTGTPPSNPPPDTPPTLPMPPGFALNGTVSGAGRVVRNASVSVYRVGSGGYGSAATLLGSATTDSTGHWTVTFDAPSDNPLIYVLVDGGDVGQGANNALALMAGVGPVNSAPTLVNVNEVTTVAAVYALTQFFDSPTRNVGAPTSNAIAACIDSNGRASTPCTTLLSITAGLGSSAPTDTRAALSAIAKHPASPVQPLVTLSHSDGAPNQPDFGAGLPNDWTLSISFFGSELAFSAPTDVVLDSSGFLYVMAQGCDLSVSSPQGCVVKLQPNGLRAEIFPTLADGDVLDLRGEGRRGLAIATNPTTHRCGRQSLGRQRSRSSATRRIVGEPAHRAGAGRPAGHLLDIHELPAERPSRAGWIQQHRRRAHDPYQRRRQRPLAFG